MITLDEYRYAEVYPSFKAATDEKVLTAGLNRKFLRGLQHAGIVLTGDAPLRVADIGSGPCDTIVQYLSGLDFRPGFIVRATDSNPVYADPVKGEAAANLSAAKLSGAIPLIDFGVRPGDSFAGHLLDLLSTRDERTPSSFCLIFASHMLYHAEDPAHCQRLLEDMVQNVMAPDGLGIFYHVAYSPHTFQDFRGRYGSKPHGAGRSDTPALAIGDPPGTLAACCAKLGIPLAEIDFSVRLQFGAIKDEEWALFKDPEKYAAASRNPETYENFKRLLFIVQRAPREFASDKSLRGLDAYIDEIREVIESNGGNLPMAEKMQVVWHPGASIAFQRKIAELVEIADEK